MSNPPLTRRTMMGAAAGVAWGAWSGPLRSDTPLRPQGDELDWPSWRGPRGDGTWNAPPVATRWPASGLPVIWTRPVGAGYSGISVAGGRVFTMDRLAPAEGPARERVLAWELASGEPLWAHAYDAKYGDLDYGKGPRAAPTVHAGRVYAFGAVGQLCCLDAATGAEMWAVDFQRDHNATQPTWGFSASPVVWRDRLIVHAGMPQGCYSAHDLATGRELWRGGDDPAGYGTPILIRHGGHEQLIGWTPEHIVGLSPESGKVQWRIPYKVTYGVSIATPIERDGTVLVSGYWEGTKAIRLGDRPEEASLLWEENSRLRGLMSQPLCRAESDGEPFVYLLDKSHGLVCCRLRTGEVLWEEPRLTPRGRNPQASLVWVGDSDRVLALNSDGELVQARLRPEGYEELARARVVGETWAHPAYSGRLVIARDDERLVCVELPSD